MDFMHTVRKPKQLICVLWHSELLQLNMYTGVPPVCALQAIHATTWKIRMPLMKVLQVGEWGYIDQVAFLVHRVCGVCML